MSKNDLETQPGEAGAVSPGDGDGPRGQQRPPSRRNRQQERPSRLPRNPVLRFSPTAWAKLTWFCLHGETEIGGFAITDPADPLYVIEFVTVRQQADWASIQFEDAAVADFFDQQVDLGRRPDQFARLWCHTHPSGSPVPSGIDEETFARVFGHCDWAILFVLARTGKTYARLRFNIGPGGQVDLPVQVDWARSFAGADHPAWLTEYDANIKMNPAALSRLGVDGGDPWDFEPGAARGNHSHDGAITHPEEPFGADAAMMADTLDLDENWAELMYSADWSELEAAAEKVRSRWGLTDCANWIEAVLSLPPDQQREFRQAVEAILAGYRRIEVKAGVR